MDLGIIENTIVEASIKGASKILLGSVLRESEIRDWVKKIDFETQLKEEIDFETIPNIDTAAVSTFFSSEPVTTLIEQIFKLNRQEISELEEDFVKIFRECDPIPESSNPELAQKLFRILICSCVSVLSELVAQGNMAAKDCLDELRHKWMRYESVHKLIHWREYFSRVEPHLLPLTGGTPLERTVHYSDIAEEFLNDNFSKILVFHTPGGFGKSHLLRHIAFVLEEKHPEYSVLSITPDSPEMEKALSNELKAGKKYLLLFDDADRWSKELVPLFAYVRNHSSDVKVILSSRTAGLQSIHTILRGTGSANIARVVELEDWNKDDLKKLLRFTLGGETHKKEDIIVTTFSNPYLIVWAGNTITGNPEISVEEHRQKFANDLESEAFPSLTPEFDEGSGKNFLADLALIAPFQKGDRSILSMLAGKYGVSEETILAKIVSLEKKGVLRQPGFSTRFNPDMKGDLYLAHGIEHLQDSGCLKKWIDYWGPYIEGKILANLEAASKYCKIDVILDYYRTWISQKIQEAKETPGYFRQKNLESLSRFCYIVLGESLDLIYTYINTPIPEDTTRLFFSHYEFPLTTDHYGPIISILMQTDVCKEDIFDLLDHVHKKVPEGSYSNYKIESLVSETVSPFTNTLESICDTLTLLENRLDGNNEFSILALGEALSKTLQVDHEFFYSPSFATITIGRRPLPDTPAVIQTRDHAISILKRMLSHPSVNIRRKSIEVCENIGLHYGETKTPLSVRVADERREVIAEIDRLISHENDYGVLSDIESLLLKWWWRGYSGTEDAERLLTIFARPMDYILYGFLFYSRINLLSFDPDTIPSEKEERSEWYFNITDFDDEDVMNEFYEYILDNYLSIKYSTASSVITLLKEPQAYRERAKLNLQHFEELMRTWVAKCPEIFCEIRGNLGIWNELPLEFQNAIDLGLCEYDPVHLEYLADDILKVLPEVDDRRTNLFIWSMARHPPDEAKTRDWLEKLIKTGNKDVHKMILRNLWVLSSNLGNYDIFTTYSLEILHYYDAVDSEILDSFSAYVLHYLKKEGDLLETKHKEALKRCLFEKLIATPMTGIYGPTYRIQELINYVLINAEDIVKFIRCRSEKKRGVSKYSVLPVDDEVLFLKNIKDSTGLYLVIEEMFTLLKEKTTYKESVCYQLKSIASLKEPDSEKLCLEECIYHLLKNDRVEDALIVCSALSFQSETQETILWVLSAAIAAGKEQEVRRIFVEYIRYGVLTIDCTGYSPQLMQKKQFITSLCDHTPHGPLKMMLRDIKKEIEAEIQEVMKEIEDDRLDR
ncbi:MAG: hypothetical protein PHP59_06465 [Methanofollis sp.]|uniref:P-loop NTPase n=1 Tax=Methanofollis sp. TaxID=2052835 RepID=UPI0026077808|nr:hypothetical protein [Methanofollis sp.]MDD4255007.1 hypothetical protein [Methanofollis sp.]